MKSTEQTAARFGALACLSLSMLLASLGTSIANIALPTLAVAFEAPFHQVQWIVIAYLVALTLFVVLAGRLGDLFGRRRMLLLGLVVFSLASALCGLAPSLWILVAARAVQGIGSAFLMTLTIAMVRETVNGGRAGRIMGLLATMSAVGTALGPSLGGLLIGLAGWPFVFFILVPIGLGAAGLAWWFLPSIAPGVTSPRRGFAALRETGVIPGMAANLLVANLMMATLLVGPFFLGFVLGLSPVSVGLVMSVGPVISICIGVPSGYLVDFWGAQRVLLIGLVGLAIGAFALSILPMKSGIVGYIAAIAILTPGYQMFQSANNTMAMANVPDAERGAVSGLLGLSRNLGLVGGASVMGAVFSFGAGAGSIEAAAPGAIGNGMQLTFMIAGASMVAALWITRGLSRDVVEA
ncbi:MFS transporter [Sulfitobacter sp. EhC04]|uniref:MFS transporter n=1 Tax=Sulfitobacter sp. EhC04 TaxID=1849168 RepID=UPI0007F49315|nr:MFS transporter [Sulfitobacter sp. EhC04]OAN67946.1 MFS transporter [Sulfitobacter sp. EhC04]